MIFGMKYTYRVDLGSGGTQDIEADFYEPEGDFVSFYRKPSTMGAKSERVASFKAAAVRSVLEGKAQA
jgi:hypothetical protein